MDWKDLFLAIRKRGYWRSNGRKWKEEGVGSDAAKGVGGKEQRNSEEVAPACRSMGKRC